VLAIYNAVTSGIVMLIWDECRCERLFGNFEEFQKWQEYVIKF
jgi:hypothetical protein